MSKENYEQVEIDEYGRKSFYVTVEIGDAIIAMDRGDAEERFISTHLKESALTGKGDPNGYGLFEVTVSGGPPIYQRKKDAPIECNKCRQDIKDEEYALHRSGECIDRQNEVIQKLIDDGYFG